MRPFRFCLLMAATTALGYGQVLAQSGVVSGPPQVRDAGPPPGPQQGPGPQPGPSAAQPGQSDTSWVAVAAGFREGRWVRVGFARRSSRGEAEVAAIEACNGGPGGVRCSNAHASSGSCLFIVAGKKRNAVTWGRGGTREVALSECRRGGYTCNERDVIGGCPDRPS
jgi:hypothetical protein